jgi:hypothetical protein
VLLVAGIQRAKEGQVVVGQAPFLIAALSRFAALAMVQIHRQVFTGVSIQAAIRAFTTVDKKLVVAHDVACLPSLVNCYGYIALD